MNSKLLTGGVRLFVLVLLCAWIVNLPEPEADSILHFRNAGVVLGAIVLGGKILYDTFFNLRRIL